MSGQTDSSSASAKLDDATSEVIDRVTERELAEFGRTLTERGSHTLIALRFHLLTENILERIIVAQLPRGDRLIDKGRLRYSQKLEVVHALNVIPDEIVGALRKLNSIRNTFSHQRDVPLGNAEIELIGRPLGKAYFKLKRDYSDKLSVLIIRVFLEIHKQLTFVAFRAENPDLGVDVNALTIKK
jgi:hypothetical protein